MSERPRQRELALHYLYSFFLYWCCSFVGVYLPLVLSEGGYPLNEIGFQLAVYNSIGLVAILLSGRLLDVFACYRSLIIGGLLIAAIAFSRLFFLKNFYWSLVAIITLAISFWPQVSSMDSYISKRYQGLAQYYGRIRSIGSAGYIAFLGLSALLSLFEPYNPWRLQAWALGLFALVALLFWASSWDSIAQIRLADKTPAAPSDKPTGLRLLGFPLLILLVLLVICWSLVHGFHNNFLALFLREELRVRYVSIFFVVATTSEIPIIFWGSRILFRKPLGWMLLLGFSAALLRLLLYALLPTVPIILLSQLLHSLAYGLFHISVIAVINRYFTRYRGTAIAIYASIPTLSNSVGAILGGILIQEYGFRIFFWILLLLVLPVFVLVYLQRQRFLYL